MPGLLWLSGLVVVLDQVTKPQIVDEQRVPALRIDDTRVISLARR